MRGKWIERCSMRLLAYRQPSSLVRGKWIERTVQTTANGVMMSSLVRGKWIESEYHYFDSAAPEGLPS